MNKLILIGNLGHDPSLKDVNGKNCANFSLGVAHGYGDKKTTIWFSCNAWEKTADICKQYLKRGSKVFIMGELSQPRIYEDRNGKSQVGLNVNVREIQMLDSKKDAEERQNAPVNSPNDIDLDNIF